MFCREDKIYFELLLNILVIKMIDYGASKVWFKKEIYFTHLIHLLSASRFNFSVQNSSVIGLLFSIDVAG